MSSRKKSMNLSYAAELARKIVAELAPGCEQIEIGGSVRRCCEKCGEIEIVAIPKHARYLFGEIAGSKLDPILTGLEQRSSLKRLRGGPRYKQYEICKTDGVHLDLFLTTPSRWPVTNPISKRVRWMMRPVETILRFADVGRGKKSWTSVLRPATANGVIREIRRHGGLMSSDIGMEFSDDGKTGTVVVGGMRSVGTCTIDPPWPEDA